MTEVMKITTLSVVTSSGSSVNKVGDIDGGLFPYGFLKDHIKKHGANGLMNKLSSMLLEVYNANIEIREDINGKMYTPNMLENE